MTTFVLSLSLQAGMVQVFAYVCGQSLALMWNLFPDLDAQACGGRRESRLKCKELPPWRQSDLRGATEMPVTGGVSSEVDVPLSANAWQPAKVMCSICVFVCTCIIYTPWVCLCLSFTRCVGVHPPFIDACFDLNISKEGAACGTVTGSKEERPNYDQKWCFHIEPMSTGRSCHRVLKQHYIILVLL